MNGADLVLAVVGIISGAGGATVIKALIDRRRGIKSDEREARRDTVADRDALLETVLTELRGMRNRLDVVESVSRARSDHIDVLEHHIWSGKGRPPPPRPEGV